jgi:glycosyltransferase involved in cell wall biosynthesis
MDIDISIVIPLFNEASTLKLLNERLAKTMHHQQKSFEIIFVDDGSTDNSIEIIKGLCNEDDHVRAVQLTRNFGQVPAVMAGCEIAKGDTIVTIDADLQNPPEEIPNLLAKIDDGYEIVFGVFSQRKHNVFRRMGSWFAKWLLSRIVAVDMTGISGFRAVKSCVIEQLKSFKEKNVFFSGLLCWTGYRVGLVEVQHDERYAGKSKYGLFKLLSFWLDMVVSFTELPFKIATIGGLFLGIIGFALAFFYLIKYVMHGSNVPGFTTIVILITCFSAIQLFTLGILGEYIGRMNREVKNRPNYIIREIID